MKDVATYAGRKMALGALAPLLFGVIGLGVGAIGMPYVILSESLKYHKSPAPLAIALFPASIGVFFFSMAVRRVRAAFEKDCWLRAGPEGLAWRLPGASHWKTLWCVYAMDERRFAWKDIREFRVRLTKINGIPTDTDLVVVGTAGWTKTLDCRYFVESAEGVRLGIIAAAKPKS